jgi:hypothetical protein
MTLDLLSMKFNRANYCLASLKANMPHLVCVLSSLHYELNILWNFTWFVSRGLFNEQLAFTAPSASIKVFCRHANVLVTH